MQANLAQDAIEVHSDIGEGVQVGLRHARENVPLEGRHLGGRVLVGDAGVALVQRGDELVAEERRLELAQEALDEGARQVGVGAQLGQLGLEVPEARRLAHRLQLRLGRARTVQLLALEAALLDEVEAEADGRRHSHAVAAREQAHCVFQLGAEEALLRLLAPAHV